MHASIISQFCMRLYTETQDSELHLNVAFKSGMDTRPSSREQSSRQAFQPQQLVPFGDPLMHELGLLKKTERRAPGSHGKRHCQTWANTVWALRAAGRSNAQRRKPLKVRIVGAMVKRDALGWASIARLCFATARMLRSASMHRARVTGCSCMTKARLEGQRPMGYEKLKKRRKLKKNSKQIHVHYLWCMRPGYVAGRLQTVRMYCMSSQQRVAKTLEGHGRSAS